jgi:serine/threonine-protein kinase
MLTGDVPFHGETPVAVAMKHVRDQAPDVQQRRPHLSAASAAVVDRAMAKDVADRYPDAATMAADVEDALAIEASRAGQATGEVTSVLRTLPGSARRRLPWRLRHPARWLGSLALLAAIVALVLVLALGHAHRGPGVAAAAGEPGLQAVPLSSTAAHGYNPFGTGPEDPDHIGNLVDNDPNTTWSTEQYYDGTLRKAGGVGLGFYLDAAPGVLARALSLQTQTPGFSVQIYAADNVEEQLTYGSSTPLAARGWHGPVGSDAGVTSGAQIPIRVSRPYRYYLVWMTTLPPHSQLATIAGVTLYR